MTREHRLVLTVDEIAAVSWQCPHCHVAISYALTDTIIRLPARCPACNEDAIDPNPGSTYRAVFVDDDGDEYRGKVIPREVPKDKPDAVRLLGKGLLEGVA